MIELIVILLVLGLIFGGGSYAPIAGAGNILWTIVWIFVILEVVSLLFGGSFHHLYL